MASRVESKFQDLLSKGLVSTPEIDKLTPPEIPAPSSSIAVAGGREVKLQDDGFHTLRTLKLVKRSRNGIRFWSGNKKQYLPSTRVAEKKRVRAGSDNPRALLPPGDFKEAKRLIEAVVRVHHFSGSSHDADLVAIARDVKPLWEFVGGEDGARNIAKKFNGRILTRLHKGGEDMMDGYSKGMTEKDLVLQVLSTAYGNSVELLSNQRAVDITRLYVTTFLAHKNASKSIRRKIINQRLIKYRNENHIDPSTVKLYHRFGSNDRQSYGATSRRRADLFAGEDSDGELAIEQNYEEMD